MAKCFSAFQLRISYITLNSEHGVVNCNFIVRKSTYYFYLHCVQYRLSAQDFLSLCHIILLRRRLGHYVRGDYVLAVMGGRAEILGGHFSHNSA